MSEQDGYDGRGGPRYENPWYGAAASGAGGGGAGAGSDAAEPLPEPVPVGTAFAAAWPSSGGASAQGAVPWHAQPLPPLAPRPAADAPAPRRGPAVPLPPNARAAVYFAVHRSAAFQEVRRRHRGFVFPVAAAFLTWYLAYLGTATLLPGLMARPVGGGPVNVAMLAGLGQFLTTALITCAYAWHARLRRDRLALELRWETQQRTREALR
ncbi:DUF485 domain-containing protein [Streptomyces sp. TRM70308]|uniref:DUF485 domain-containing protein n=1 Tax=Streptomyces sp. TRM70308 TaxID=3131932 RepID=UPI003D06058D